MANSKVTALTELSAVADADILYIVDDPGGTPTSKKITRQNLITSATITRASQSIASGDANGLVFDNGDLTITGGSSNFYQHKFLKADVTAASALTITNAATLYIDDAPDDVGSATITNKYAMWVDAGTVRFDGTLKVDTITEITSNNGVNIEEVYMENSGSDAFIFRAARTVGAGTHTGLTYDNEDWTLSAGATAIRQHAFTKADITAASALTVSDAATLYIDGAPAALASATITRTYPLWIDSGTMRYDDNVAMGGVTSATLGTVPAGAPDGAQDVWLRLYSGTSVYGIPAWLLA